MMTTGNYVSGVAGFTTLLTTVVSVDPMYVYASVAENRYLHYQRMILEKKMQDPRTAKVEVELQVSGENSYSRKGVIESFDNRMDPATGSIVLRAVFPNPDGILVPGAFAKVRIPGSEEYEALLVDEKLIGTDQNEKFVLTFSNGIAARTAIKLGALTNGQRVVLEGLKSGDQIISSGLQMLRPGAPVMALPAAPPADPSAKQP
jgi:RND family efflux transporter MFP subunit